MWLHISDPEISSVARQKRLSWFYPLSIKGNIQGIRSTQMVGSVLEKGKAFSYSFHNNYVWPYRQQRAPLSKPALCLKWYTLHIQFSDYLHSDLKICLLYCISNVVDSHTHNNRGTSGVFMHSVWFFFLQCRCKLEANRSKGEHLGA